MSTHLTTQLGQIYPASFRTVVTRTAGFILVLGIPIVVVAAFTNNVPLSDLLGFLVAFAAVICGIFTVVWGLLCVLGGGGLLVSTWAAVMITIFGYAVRDGTSTTVTDADGQTHKRSFSHWWILLANTAFMVIVVMFATLGWLPTAPSAETNRTYPTEPVLQNLERMDQTALKQRRRNIEAVITTNLAALAHLETDSACDGPLASDSDIALLRSLVRKDLANLRTVADVYSKRFEQDVQPEKV